MIKAKRFAKIAAALVVVLSMAGCWDSHELDTLSIVVGVGIDASEQPDEINLVVQVGKMTRSGSSEEKSVQEKAFILAEATGRTILGAIEKMNDKSSRTMYLHHNEIILLGRSQAEKGVKQYLDSLMRGDETRMMVWVLVADNTAREILSVEPEPEKIPALSLNRMMEYESRISEALGVKLLDFTSKLIDKTTSPVAPIVRTVQEDDEVRLELTGTAVFKDDKMVGQMDMLLTQGYAWVVGSVEDGFLSVRTDAGEAVLNINKTECKTDLILNEDGGITVSHTISGGFSLSEIYGFEDMDMKTVVSLIKQATVAEIEKQITECFEAAKKLNADIFGYGTAVHRKYPRQWKYMEQQWDLIFPTVMQSLDIDIIVTDTGKIANSLVMGEE